VYSDGSRCSDNNIEGKTFCCLHQPFPIEKSVEYNTLNAAKKQRVQEKLLNNDFNFEGAYLTDFDVRFISDLVNANFRNATFYENTFFHSLNFNGNTIFSNSTFKKWASFSNSTFHGEVYFNEAYFSETVWFKETAFEKKVSFWKTEFHMDVQFFPTIFQDEVLFFRTYFKGLALFNGSKFQGKTWFNKADIRDVASFKKVEFNDEVNFIAAKPEGPILFEESTFKLMSSKESAYRFAKQAFESIGDHERADSCFFEEMVAKRMQHPEIQRFFEFVVVQLVFGYGVKPLRTICSWLLVIFSYAVVYYNLQSIRCEDSFLTYFYYSTINSITPGWSSYSLKTPIDQFFAGSEAIIGTVLVAAFIVIFARKYMRS
jgi:uncharacterized protein YjbI with pentapeptide repeats